jgi:hypothetical protein
LKRLFHHYEKWEDFKNGMWRRESKQNETDYLNRAIEFTGDHQLYGSWMLRVIEEWPISCENNLTFMGMNRRAWVGHAAACMAINSPEYITRAAWGRLTKDQQDLANKQADKAIRIWEQKNGYVNILRHGKRGVTRRGFRMKPQPNLNLPRLFLLIAGFAWQSLGMIYVLNH